MSPFKRGITTRAQFVQESIDLGREEQGGVKAHQGEMPFNVHGATGGVGVLLVPLARLADARVIETASPAKHNGLRSAQNVLGTTKNGDKLVSGFEFLIRHISEGRKLGPE